MILKLIVSKMINEIVFWAILFLLKKVFLLIEFVSNKMLFD